MVALKKCIEKCALASGTSSGVFSTNCLKRKVLARVRSLLSLKTDRLAVFLCSLFKVPLSLVPARLRLAASPLDSLDSPSALLLALRLRISF